MSLIIPDSTVNLYAEVPISGDHQLVFSSRSKQATYFLNKRVASKAGCSYLRKTGKLRIEWSTSRVMQSNYISFTNPSFENVTFYAKITDWEYVNNETTDIMYEIDWWQTYMFDFDAHACGIIREQLTEEDYQKAVANPWRRDIPELLTNETLPMSESLECIYTNGENQAGILTGNRFKMSSGIPEISEGMQQLKIVMYLSAIENFDNLEASQRAIFRAFLSKWETLNGQDFDYATVNVNQIFSSTAENFIRSYAVLSMPISNSVAFSEALTLLTQLGVNGNIVGLYVLPNWMSAGGSFDNGFIVPKLNVKSPKLNTFPYRYLRIKSPQDTKEYRLDLFKDLSESEDGEAWVRFRFVSNVCGLPIMAIMPVSYKTNGAGNYFERIEYSNFPQVAYSTDAYLAYIAAQEQQALIKWSTPVGQATFDYEAMQRGNPYLDMARNLVGSVSNMGMSSNGVSNIIGAAQNVMMNTQKANLENARVEQNVYENIGASMMGSGYSATHNNSKPAYISNEYHPGGNGGYLAYEYNMLDFTCEIVELSPEVLEKYDTYFECYGYNSARYGLPHIIDYIKNGTNTPHFSTYNGDTFTYVQTENMHITGVQTVASRFIEEMFNRGVRFLKGD